MIIHSGVTTSDLDVTQSIATYGCNTPMDSNKNSFLIYLHRNQLHDKPVIKNFVETK